jgi:hypothetical protein
MVADDGSGDGERVFEGVCGDDDGGGAGGGRSAGLAGGGLLEEGDELAVRLADELVVQLGALGHEESDLARPGPARLCKRPRHERLARACEGGGRGGAAAGESSEALRAAIIVSLSVGRQVSHNGTETARTGRTAAHVPVRNGGRQDDHKQRPNEPDTNESGPKNLSSSMALSDR